MVNTHFKKIQHKMTEFIEGKWYKTQAGSFVKYSHTDSDGLFRTSENIMYGTQPHEIVDGKFGQASNIKNFTEADLSEFSDLLPENHPDKKFVLPKTWYIQLTEENQKEVEKWHRSVDNVTSRFYHIDSYYGWEKNHAQAWAFRNLPTNSNLITYDQFKKYVLNSELVKEDYSYLIDVLKKYKII